MVDEETKKDIEEKEDIEIITGDSKNLDISPVYEHIKSDTVPTENKKKNIVIPKSNSERKKAE